MEAAAEMRIESPRGPVGIRQASAADAMAYRDLRLEALRDHPEAFGSDHGSNLARPMSFWEERLSASGSPGALTLFFAVHDGNLVGMCGIAPGDGLKTRHSADIVSVYVRPEWRGLGVAGGLLEACLAWGRAQGVVIVKLGVASTNTAAIRCYARLGFHVYGLDPKALCVSGDYQDELLMAREI